MSTDVDTRKKKQVGLLFKNKSKSGKEYFSGAINGVKVVVFNSGKKTKNGNEMWNIMEADEPREPGEGD